MRNSVVEIAIAASISALNLTACQTKEEIAKEDSAAIHLNVIKQERFKEALRIAGIMRDQVINQAKGTPLECKRDQYNYLSCSPQPIDKVKIRHEEFNRLTITREKKGLHTNDFELSPFLGSGSCILEGHIERLTIFEHSASECNQIRAAAMAALGIENE